MKAIVYVLFLQGCLSFDIPRDGCSSDLNISNDHYNVSNTYHIGEAYPTDAHYDIYGNLFYVESGRNENGFYFNAHVLKSQATTAEKVVGLPENLSYSIAVDRKNTGVYFGTGKGIYSYNYESHTATPISRADLKLSMIFVDKDGKKYITESNNGVEELYLLNGNEKIRFGSLDALNGLTIDDNNNFYFIKDEKLCILKTRETAPSCVGNILYDGIAQLSFHEEKVFVASQNLTYIHTNDAESLKTVEKIPGKVTAIAFDKTGGFALGIHGKILKYKKNNCYIKNKSNGVDMHIKEGDETKTESKC